jgi:hypothetical protein
MSFDFILNSFIPKNIFEYELKYIYIKDIHEFESNHKLFFF